MLRGLFPRVPSRTRTWTTGFPSMVPWSDGCPPASAKRMVSSSTTSYAVCPFDSLAAALPPFLPFLPLLPGATLAGSHDTTFTSHSTQYESLWNLAKSLPLILLFFLPLMLTRSVVQTKKKKVVIINKNN